MGQVTQTRDIDGLAFKVTQLGGMRGVRTFAQLAKLAGPALTKGLGAFNGQTKLADMNVSVLGEAVESLLEKLSPDELEALTRTLLETATVNMDGKETALMPVFELVMQGRAHTVFKLLWFALEVNFGPFWQGLAPKLMAAARTAGPKSDLQTA